MASILEFWERHGSDRVAGLAGLDADVKTGELIGTAFAGDVQETTLTGFYAAGGRGDKKLVYRTALMKQLPPYPVFPGEKYVGLGYKYMLADRVAPLLTMNKVLCLVEYREDGSSRNMFRQYVLKPAGIRLSAEGGNEIPALPASAVHGRRFITSPPPCWPAIRVFCGNHRGRC